MEILLVFVLLYASKHAWDHAWEAWGKSRSAYMERAKPSVAGHAEGAPRRSCPAP